MLQVGNLVINLNAVAHVDLNATKTFISRENVSGVRIFLLTTQTDGNLVTLFFSGDEAQYLRSYFTNSVVGVGR